MVSRFVMVVFLLLSFSCHEDSGKGKRGGGENPINTPPNGSDNTTANVKESEALNCDSDMQSAQLNIHQKYCAFNREVWIDFKDKYFREDGQHVDRWQEEGGPEEWHIPDGGVVQGIMLGAYVLEYKWTQSKASLDKVQELKSGMEVLEKVTGVPGLIARVAVKKNGRPRPDWLNTDGMVYKDSAIPDYVHRADVSGDQYSGLAWGLAMAAKYGPPEISQWASAYAKRVVKYLAANDYRLVVDGKVTEHGDMAPTDIAGYDASALGLVNGMHVTKILAFYRIANLLNPEPQIVQAEQNFKNKWHGKGMFKVNIDLPFVGNIMKGDNLFQVSQNFQSYLTVAPEDKIYRQLYKEFLEDGGHIGRQNAFDDFAMAFHLKEELAAKKQTIQNSANLSLQDFPYPKMIRNQPEDRFGTSGSSPLPVNQRVVNSWTWGENPCVKGMEPTPEAKALKHRFSPMDYIAVYNMGRAYGIIAE